MNTLAHAQGLEPRRRGGGTPEVTWAQIATRAPVMVTTMASYLDQLEVSARPGTVAGAEMTLRFFAHRVTEADPSCVSVARIARPHIEDFKTWLLQRRGGTGKPLATMTIRHRLSTVRTFFERIMEWDYDDAPARLFIYMSDFPALDEPLPKFLDDPTAAKFMAALAEDPNLRRRLMVELLARTGIRVGELAGLRRRRRGAQRRRPSPPHPPRQAAQRPLRSSPADAGRPHRRVQGRARALTFGPPPRRATTAEPSTGAPCIATWPASPSGPGSVTSIRTSCATRWPPSPSTGA